MTYLPMIHVVGPERRRRPWFAGAGRRLAWVAVAGIAALAVWLLPAGLSAQAVAGDAAWRSAGAARGPAAYLDALPAGQEAEFPLYACRAIINRDVHIGRVRSDFSGCHIGFDGKEVEITPFETLGVVWRQGGDAPLAAGSEVVAMPESALDTAPLFPCRAAYQGGVHSGQARAGEKGCSFGFGGRRITVTPGEVLQASPWLTWSRATAHNLPDNAIVGGNESGEPIFVCRAADRDGLHPGKIKRSSNGCSIVSEGREMAVDRFEVLTGRWIAGRAGTIPVSAAVAGREAGGPQYVCRAQTRDGMQVGKVSEALGGCHVGMLGREVVVPEYEVLSQ